MPKQRIAVQPRFIDYLDGIGCSYISNGEYDRLLTADSTALLPFSVVPTDSRGCY